MGNKVVYNACYGGFALSKKAVEFIENRVKEMNKDSDSKHFNVYEIERHNSVLVQCVETLGKEANGYSSNLKVFELPEGCNQYYIEEFDGFERVITPDDFVVIE